MTLQRQKFIPLFFSAAEKKEKRKNNPEFTGDLSPDFDTTELLFFAAVGLTPFGPFHSPSASVQDKRTFVDLI